MSTYEAAHQLARKIKESEEFRTFIDAKDIIKAHESHHRMIREFQHIQFEIQQAQLFNLDIPEEKQQELERLYSLLSLNPSARQYLEAEFRVSRLVNDVQKIIGDAILEALPIGFEETDEPHLLI